MKMVCKKAIRNAGILALLLFCSFTAVKYKSPVYAAAYTKTNTIKNVDSSGKSLYDKMNLAASGLSKQAFQYAVSGYNYLLGQGKIKNAGVLSIVDFSLPSNVKRLFVIDLDKYAILFNTYVSHGRNSGRLMASSFSNAPNSFKSSLGFYLTSQTYNGKHGYSLRLDGQEQGINDNALNRGIVMHCAPYVSEAMIKSQGYIGRSEGCPAISPMVYKPVIEKIKDGSCLFMYSPDDYYLSHSAIVKNGNVG